MKINLNNATVHLTFNVNYPTEWHFQSLSQKTHFQDFQAYVFSFLSIETTTALTIEVNETLIRIQGTA